ncbi:hypothetical protein LCGC14_0345950 [marine sediment metagenome]|uniref:Uncharacterized protein n=1 Tax=marine sediment metagenome TaxID=412755 RepID=A0A0F9WK36_9ZZZZ
MLSTNFNIGNRHILLGEYHPSNVGGLGFELMRCYDGKRGGWYGWNFNFRFIVYNFIIRITRNV